MKQVSYHTSCRYQPELNSVLKIIEQQYLVRFILTERKDQAQISFDETGEDGIYFPGEIYVRIYAADFSPSKELQQGLLIEHQGKPDILGTIFYLVNCVQEYKPGENQKDKFGRYNSEHSFQFRNKLEKRNYVSELVEQFVVTHLSLFDLQKVQSKTRIFLSHDIDNVYGSITQDSFWAIKNFRWNDFLKVVVENLFIQPHWLNMDRIMNMESEYDFKSTFFWLVQNGKTDYRMANSDYRIGEIKPVIHNVQKNGWFNGLHKSVGQMSFQQEMELLPDAVRSNRFHYLRFDPHQDFEKIEESGIRLDCSLGFPDMVSMRNSYGLPYHPFDLKNRKSFSFLECPLHMMDTTFHNYSGQGAETFVGEVISFVERNNTNCVLSLLFHNNYISDYKFSAYLGAFKTLLSYFYESKYSCITEQEIIEQYDARY